MQLSNLEYYFKRWHLDHVDGIDYDEEEAYLNFYYCFLYIIVSYINRGNSTAIHSRPYDYPIKYSFLVPDI